MGMAASQARLLSLTSRLHDIEFKAQNLQSQKLALATQKDQLYQDYCEALDATTIKVAFMGTDSKTNYVDATFSNLCDFNESRCVDYALVNNRSGKLIVSEEVKQAFDQYGHKDKYAFAWTMLGVEEGLSEKYGAEMLAEIGINQAGNFDYVQYGSLAPECMGTIGEGDGTFRDDLYMTDVEYNAYSNNKASDPGLETAYNNLVNGEPDEKTKLLQIFREALYSNTKCVEQIYNSASQKTGNNVSWGDLKEKFDYYVNLWSAINEAGGCEAIEKGYESGENGETWLNNMVNSGHVSILYINRSESREWTETTVATSTNHNYLKEEQDETDLKKAEIAYEHGLDLINRKDTKFDTELSKLETERTAITTEMESISKVRDENVERTFGIFS